MRLLDSFDDITPWQVSASEDVTASLRRAEGSAGHALCIDFDFGRVSGYAVAQRQLPLEYPANYEFSFGVRGDAPANTLQFKLVDASGENVWWVNRPDYAFPHEWQRVRFKKRHIEFAWGPSKDRRLTRSATLEFVIARGQGGGKGTVCFDRLAFLKLPADASPPSAPVVRASSTLAPTHPADAIDGRMETAWRSDPATGPQQTLVVDFGRPREFGGLVLHWLPHLYASQYTVDFSDDGEHWRTVRRVV
ncbi:MAG TPA: discoidin domain-containing protein, partial [Candidatus Methylomirabilis sp.]|nr:discoidin domain-containing protein [Candidatus Methylomirabilis sp.]